MGWKRAFRALTTGEGRVNTVGWTGNVSDLMTLVLLTEQALLAWGWRLDDSHVWGNFSQERRQFAGIYHGVRNEPHLAASTCFSRDRLSAHAVVEEDQRLLRGAIRRRTLQPLGPLTQRRVGIVVVVAQLAILVPVGSIL